MASATTSEATPAATPAIEIPVITPMTAWRRLARRYRVAINSSKRIKEAISFQLSAAFDYSGALRRVEQHKAGPAGQCRVAQHFSAAFRPGHRAASAAEVL